MTNQFIINNFNAVISDLYEDNLKLAKECGEKATWIIVGKLSPGIMIDDFIKQLLVIKKILIYMKKLRKYIIY